MSEEGSKNDRQDKSQRRQEGQEVHEAMKKKLFEKVLRQERIDEEKERLPTIDGIEFVNYTDESQLDDVMRLVGRDLSEPYSIFTYRYFLHQWPQLCILAVPAADNCQNRKPIGCVVCKIDFEQEEQEGQSEQQEEQTQQTQQTQQQAVNIKEHPNNNNQSITLTGYIGMLAIDSPYRRSGIGLALATRAIRRMITLQCTSIRLEAETTNIAAMKLYEEKLGFVREELLSKYYLNWNDAYRLRLWIDLST